LQNLPMEQLVKYIYHNCDKFIAHMHGTDI
jgi:hypothetical protein